MIKDLLQFLRAPAPAADAHASEEDARTAIAAVLVDVAMADGDYASTEVAMIDQVLAETYGLAPPDAEALRAKGEAAQAVAVDSHRFTTVLKASVPHEDRVALFEKIWRVALADGVRDDAENALLRKLVGLLHITDQDSAAARRRAASALGQ